MASEDRALEGYGNAHELPSRAEATRARQRFTEIAARAEADLDIAEAALWLAAESCAGLDVEANLARIEVLADEVTASIAEGASHAERIEAVNQALFVAHGFRGERVDYYDPANSFLNIVLDRKCGIPISLCVLYVAVARRAGLQAHGVSFPGHFLAKISAPPGSSSEADVFIDAFEGQTISEQGCRTHLRNLFGPEATLTHEMTQAASNKEILARMLSNLKTIFVNSSRFEQALACCDRLLLLAPSSAIEYRDRALVYQRLDCARPAVTDLERYLELAPDDPGVPAVRKLLASLCDRLPQVH